MIDLDLSDQIATLRQTFSDIRAVVGVDKLAAEIADLSEQAGAQDLWDDPEAAQKVTSTLSHRQTELARIESLQRRIDDLEVLVQMANEGDDADSADEAKIELTAIQKNLGELEVTTLLNGEYDDRPAVITIRSGAGGVDAADFAEMLMRMYLRTSTR
jgi:peptide chain release factor 2